MGKIIGAILGILGILTGLGYIIFPNFFIKYHMNFWLGTKGLLILGIILIVISIFCWLLNYFSRGYRKFLNKYKGIILVLEILNWTLSILIFLALVNTTGAIVQSFANA